MPLNFKDTQNQIVFIPLGGSNEIGMNLNLYGYKDQWIIVDVGIGFADEFLPGVDVIVPDISFLQELKGKILGIVLTHAHEDHFGGIPYLWDEINVPVYATPFTGALLKLKLAEEGMRGRVEVKEIKPSGKFALGPFEIEMIELPHSIPEMQALAIRTDKGVIFHTGDWKFDHAPLTGPAADLDVLKRYGDEGVMAIVCDSTNVFVPGESGSEEGVRERLIEAVKACPPNRVVVTTFASNLARVETVFAAAEASGRRVVMAGRSLWRVYEAAKEAGYLKNCAAPVSDREASNIAKDKTLILCTGCQGEARAALSKIARGEHHNIRLTPGDTVIYSSRKIPGNESKIAHTHNQLVQMGIEVMTDKDLDVHVSGHPARDELIRMYGLLKPRISIPVHGEPRHLHEHAKLARSLGVPFAIEMKNGMAVTIDAEKGVRQIATVASGYVAIDGITLLPTDSPVLRTRRKMRDDGSVFIAIAVDEDWKLAADVSVTAPGSLDPESDADLIDAITEAVTNSVENMKRNVNTPALQEAARQAARRICNNELGKKPIVEVLVLKV